MAAGSRTKLIQPPTSSAEFVYGNGTSQAESYSAGSVILYTRLLRYYRQMRRLGLLCVTTALLGISTADASEELRQNVQRMFGSQALDGRSFGPARWIRGGALTNDGSQTQINGAGDWVYEEELNLWQAFRWSPSLYPRLTIFPYPKAGTRNPAVRIGIVTATGGQAKWISLPGDARENYVFRMDWSTIGISESVSCTGGKTTSLYTLPMSRTDR